MTPVEKKLLVELTIRGAANEGGEIFLKDFIPSVLERQKVFHGFCDFYSQGYEETRRDDDYDEVDASSFMVFLANQLLGEL